MRIHIIDRVDPVLAELLHGAGHECVAATDVEGDELFRSMADANGIIVRSKQLNADRLRSLGQLRFIGRVGSGLENIDRKFCEANGIQVFNSPEGNRDGVGELCVLQCLALLKHLVRAHDQVKRGMWLREENRGTDLQGRTIGIIGFGNMGSSFAQKLKGFDVRILAHDKFKNGFGSAEVEECDLPAILSESDIISLHLPLNDSTEHFADRAFFDRLRRPVHFLNTSRGGIVDTEALLDAIDEGKVVGAALDVLEFERKDLAGLDPTFRPDVQKRLLAHDRVLLTPHIAGVTHEGARKMAIVLARKIIDAFQSNAIG